MVIFGLATVLTGICNFFPPFKDEFNPPHATAACIFGLLVGIHIWLNRKAVFRHFRRLRWWWILVGLGFVYVIWIGIGMPILVDMGILGG
jgi:hypothetical protein